MDFGEPAGTVPSERIKLVCEFEGMPGGLTDIGWYNQECTDVLRVQDNVIRGAVYGS